MSTWTDEKHEWAQYLAGRFTHPGEDTKVLLADALVEIKRLRALTTITDEKVRRAAEALGDATSLTLGADALATNPDTVGVLHDDARAILEAAHNPPT